jgi:hypothetical protein
MALIAQQPAETTVYFIAGFSVILGTIFLYVLSLCFRWRQSYRDLKNLQSIDKFEKF